MRLKSDCSVSTATRNTPPLLVTAAFVHAKDAILPRAAGRRQTMKQAMVWRKQTHARENQCHQEPVLAIQDASRAEFKTTTSKTSVSTVETSSMRTPAVHTEPVLAIQDASCAEFKTTTSKTGVSTVETSSMRTPAVHKGSRPSDPHT
jgi:hypothetical protein